MKKKGMIGEQVNWIYVLIAGSLILAFFATMAIRQKGEADRNQARESLKAIDELMFQPPRSSQLVHFPNIELSVSCDETGITSLKIGKEQPIKPIEPVFAPTSINSNEIIAMTNEWNIPFKASNFVYLTANDTRYIIIYNDAVSRIIAEQISKEIPEQANKAVQEDTKPLVNTNSRRTVLIGAGIRPNTGGLPKEKTSVIQINPTVNMEKNPPTVELEEGSIIFIENGGNQMTITYPYTGKAMMLGAIFSANRKSFDCSMKRAYEKAAMVSTIYSIKASRLAAAQIEMPRCRDKYSREKIDEITSLNPNEVAESTAKLKELKKEIDEQNRKALLDSCPVIY